MEQFKSNTVNGNNNLVLNDALNQNILYFNKKGALQKNIITTTNLYNYQDTRYVTTGITVDEEGWTTVNYDNSEGTSTEWFEYHINVSNKIKTSTQYAVVVEVQENNNTSFVLNGSSDTSQFDGGSVWKENTNSYIELLTTHDDFSSATKMLSTYVVISAGSIGSMKFRISVIEDTSITIDNFIYSPFIEDSVEFKTIENLSIKISDTYNNSTTNIIDLQDNFLGQIGEVQDELSINEYGIISILKRILKIDSYNNEDITTDYVSSTDDLSEGATVYYVNPNPYSKDIGLINIKTFEGTNNVEIISNLESETTIKYVIGLVNKTDNNLIKVYDSNETLFANNGIKILHPLLAEITKKDNDDYYVELRDTIDNYEYYQKGMIVRIPTPWGVQGFRCDNPEINNNRVECKAWHLTYDSENYIIKDSNAVDKNCNDALNHFNSATDTTSNIISISDISKILSTRAVRKSLFDIYKWFITDEKYGGHWYRDNFVFGIKNSIGEDRGVVLSVNKNITDIKISENWDNVCTKILPYTTDGENSILLDDTYVSTNEELYDIPYTKIVKFENELNKDDYETEDDYIIATKNLLKAKADNYLEENKFPKINYSVSAKIENVSDVGDTIYVKIPKCKVDIQTNVISIVYDAIRKKYIKIEFGNFKKEIKNLTQQITENVKKDTENIVSENNVLLKKELEEATAKINSVLGNSYVEMNGNEILVVDTLPKEDATYCLRINSAGIGLSTNGIHGTFNSAWTIDGTLDMQQLNVINLTASLIKGGTLIIGGVNNSSGTFELYDDANTLIGEMTKNGLKMYGTDGSYVLLNNDVGFAGYDKNNNKIYWVDKDEFHMKKSVVEEEITLCNKMRFIPITIYDDNNNNIINDGIGLVSTVN